VFHYLVVGSVVGFYVWLMWRILYEFENPPRGLSWQQRQDAEMIKILMRPKEKDENIVGTTEKEKRSKDQSLIDRYGLTPVQISGLRLQMETYDHNAAFAEMHSDPRGQFFEGWAKTIREDRCRLTDYAGTLGFTVDFALEEPRLFDEAGILVDVVYHRWPRGRDR